MIRASTLWLLMLNIVTPSVPAAPPSPSFLPVGSPPLGPGRLEAQPLDPTLAERLRRLPRPFFLIGSDPLSRDWLARHRERLETLGAIGMLVQVESTDELDTIRAIGRHLPIVPASASALAETLGLTRYPVLISPQGIEQ